MERRPPVLFRLAGHPLRWRLLSELAESDRRVRELTGTLRRPQSLVSYHLGLLRSAGLVTTHRSSFDGRDAYYSLNLQRYGELLTATGAFASPRQPRTTTFRVLFLCTGNSSRSQIAEALAAHLSGGRFVAVSAGSKPKTLHPNAVRVMRERGIDISGHQTKSLTLFTGRRFDYVISLCDRVREVCPEFPHEPETIHWSIQDPAAVPDGDDDTYPVFEQTAAELEARIRFLLHRIDAREAPHERSEQ